MKKLLSILLFVAVIVSVTNAKGEKIYDPSLDGMKQIDEAVQKAKSENKHVLIQVGGNWCHWCILMHKYIDATPEVKKMIEDNFIFVELNTSKENKNKKSLKRLEYPQRFGYPVMVVLDSNGKRIHTQSTGILEDGKGYDKKKILSFLKGWTPAAINPANYK